MCNCLICDCIWCNCLGICAGISCRILCCSCWLCKLEEMKMLDYNCCHICQNDGLGFNCILCGMIFCTPSWLKIYSRNKWQKQFRKDVIVAKNNQDFDKSKREQYQIKRKTEQQEQRKRNEAERKKRQDQQKNKRKTEEQEYRKKYQAEKKKNQELEKARRLALEQEQRKKAAEKEQRKKDDAERKKKQEQEKAKKEEQEKKKKDNAASSENFANSVKQQITCPFCYEIMSIPVAIQPCNHRLCGGCLTELVNNKKDTCIQCRKEITTAVRDAAFTSIIEFYLKSHPSEKRDPKEEEDLKAKNIFGFDPVNVRERIHGPQL